MANSSGNFNFVPGVFSYGETVKASEDQIQRLPDDILRIIFQNPIQQPQPILDEQSKKELWIAEKIKNHEWFELGELRTSSLPSYSKYEESDELQPNKICRNV